MPTTSSRWNWRLPTSGDVANVPTDLANLSADIGERVGRALRGALQLGVFDSNDFRVAAGAGMTVQVASGLAILGETADANNVLVSIYSPNSGVILTIATAHATLPRLDQVFLSSAGVLSVVAGTPTSGATLDNRNGAAAAPNNTIRLADVLVPAASASVSGANIRDRRQWARGGHSRQNRTAANWVQPASGPISIITTPVARLECSGNARLRMSIRASVTQTAAAGTAWFYPLIDGLPIDSMVASTSPFKATFPINTDNIVNVHWDTDPNGGSRLLQWGISLSAGTATILGTAGAPIQLIVEEIVRPSTDNS